MKCLALLSCEKVIIDKEGAHSIINVMLNADVKLQRGLEDVSIPLNAVLPHQWWIYSQWNPSLDDVGQTFEQVYQIFWPNEEKFVEGKLPFKQDNEKVQQTTFSIVGFPAGQSGQLKITTWLESHGRQMTDVYRTHVNISHHVDSPSFIPAPFPISK